MSAHYLPLEEIEHQARARNKLSYRKLVPVFIVILVIFCLPYLLSTIPLNALKRAKFHEYAKLDQRAAEENLDGAPDADFFYGLEKNIKSSDMPSMLKGLPADELTSYKAARKQIMEKYNVFKELVNIGRTFVSFLIGVLIVGPLNAGYARYLLKMKDADESIPDPDAPVKEDKLEVKAEYYISGMIKELTFAFRDNRYFNAVRTYTLFFAVGYIPVLVMNFLEMTGKGNSYFYTLGLGLCVLAVFLLGFEFTFVDFIFAETPDARPLDIYKESMRLMRGNKKNLWALLFSYYVWILLIIFTAGVGIIFFIPVIRCAASCFYEWTKGSQ